MTEDEFYHKELMHEYQNYFTDDDSMVTLYRKIYRHNENNHLEKYIHIFSYLCAIDSKDKCLETYQYDIFPDNNYHTIPAYSYENILFVREFYFDSKKTKYIDIAEDIVLTLNLLEECDNKKDRLYFKIVKEKKDLAIQVTDSEVKIKISYLNEYLISKQKYLITYFQFESEITTKSVIDFEIIKMDETKSFEDSIVNFFIRQAPGTNIIQSWYQGKTIREIPKIISRDIALEFIVGVDKRTGNEETIIYNDETRLLFMPIYFQKEVLEKYYDGNYNITDFKLDGRDISITFDNHHKEYIVISCYHLRDFPLDHYEHWRSYNIIPPIGGNFSRGFNQRFLIGCYWNSEEVGTPDLQFKNILMKFQDQFYNKNKWYLFKPLATEQTHLLKKIHIPSKNDLAVLTDIVGTLSLILCDNINVTHIKSLGLFSMNKEDKEKKILILSKYLECEGLIEEHDDHITFLLKLQAMRSKGLSSSHPFSTEASKIVNDYFGFEDINSNSQNLSESIFIKARDFLISLCEKIAIV